MIAIRTIIIKNIIKTQKNITVVVANNDSNKSFRNDNGNRSYD